jgi:hypothetical protein
MSRHKHQPTDHQRHQVLTLAGLGIPQVEIAGLLRLAPKTLRARYRYELDTGATRANAAVAQSLYNMAVRDKVPSAAIWWTKARMGWKEQQDVNVGGQANNPMAIDFTWAPALPPAASTAPPVIDGTAEAEAEDGGPVVVWQSGER